MIMMIGDGRTDTGEDFDGFSFEYFDVSSNQPGPKGIFTLGGSGHGESCRLHNVGGRSTSRLLLWTGRAG
jgi:hypothetical protein